MTQECPICIESIGSSPWGVCSPCGHALHGDCWRELVDNGRGGPCPVCKCRVESFVKVYLDVDGVDRDEEICDLQEAVCCKDVQLTQLEENNRKMKVEVCNLKRTVCEKEAELEQIYSELCESNEKNCQLEEEVVRQLKNLEVKNKVIGKSKQQARQSQELVRQRNAKLKEESRLSQHQMRELQSENQRCEAENIAQFLCGICSSIVPSFNFWASGCCSKLFCGECLINCGTIIVCQNVGCQQPIRTHPGSNSPVGWTQNHPFTKKLIEDCAPSCYGCKKNIPKSKFEAHRLACPALNQSCFKCTGTLQGPACYHTTCLDSLFANEKSAVDSDNIVDERISDEGANLDEQLPASEAISVESVVSGAYNASISLENLSTTVSQTTGSNNSSGARKEEKLKTPVVQHLVNHMELMMKMDYWLGVGTNDDSFDQQPQHERIMSSQLLPPRSQLKPPSSAPSSTQSTANTTMYPALERYRLRKARQQQQQQQSAAAASNNNNRDEGIAYTAPNSSHGTPSRTSRRPPTYYGEAAGGGIVLSSSALEDDEF